MLEINLDPVGSPYSTIYLLDSKMGLDTPNGMVWKEISKETYEELKQYAEEGEAT